MNVIKKLASQTLIYGLSTMLGRFINFLLIIPQTARFDTVADYGQLTVIFGTVAFLNILLTYGMETAYFNFIRHGHNESKVFGTAQKAIWITTLIFVFISILGLSGCAQLLGYPNHKEYALCCILFLAFDALTALPFARLRHQEQPLRFAIIRLASISINVLLNYYFLYFDNFIVLQYNQVTAVLVANLLASAFSFLLLFKSATDINKVFDKALLLKMWQYAWPLIFVGFAGIVNETIDRVMLKHLLPANEADAQAGIYGAFYKLTMVMTMFVQAFRFAAEPFFFKNSTNSDNKQHYAQVLYWFVGVCSTIFVVCMLFVEQLANLFIRNKAFFADDSGLQIVPILLMANLFLGIYYNLSIWYKLSDKTKWGAILAVSAAIITLVANYYFIPLYGFTACAWVTCFVYLLMCIAAYILGNIYYPVPYPLVRILFLLCLAVGMYLLDYNLSSETNNAIVHIIVKIAIILVFMLIIWKIQPKQKKA